ncbi:hypothetical protein ICJ52_19265 [Streptomyces sp. KD18]|nr:hypothetical protein [Streptomyces toxytricini]MBD3578362.1 hypothetical protein [Streptomyces sp. KD18]
MAVTNTGNPMPRFERARTALERFAPLAWLKCTPEIDHTGRIQAPLPGWRFSEPHPELKEMFMSVVKDAPQNVTWVFKERRNSLIAPSRLTQHEQGGEDHPDLAIAPSGNDQQFCIAASHDIDLIIHAIAAQPALPTATRLYVTQIAKVSPDELVCIVKSFTGEARVGMLFRAVGAPDIEVRLAALHWYPLRPETVGRAPLAKVTLVGHGAGRIDPKELLVSFPDH